MCDEHNLRLLILIMKMNFLQLIIKLSIYALYNS